MLSTLDPQLLPAISLHQVSKQVGPRRLVNSLQLDVMAGETLGFLGPNGAGKTTTIRLLTGFLRPSTGVVRLLGYDMAQPVSARQARQRLGFVPDNPGLDTNITGLALLDDLARLQRQPPLDREHLLNALDLDPADLRRPLGQLSRGTRQKINLVQGLQHRPDLLVLDEPTEGLDPLARRALFTLLRAAQQRGATIFFSSHGLGEVEALCDRVALIRRGSLVAVDRIEHLRRHLLRRVTLHLGHAAPTDVEDQLRTLPTVINLVYTDERWRFQVAELPPLLHLLSALPVLDVTIEPPSLEDVFLHYYSTD